MSKHTPGPWVSGQRLHTPGKIDLLPVGIPESNFGIVCYTVASVHCYGENAEANARLIAAAPELLDAVKDLRDYLAEYEPDGGELARRVAQIIAKAEGRGLEPENSSVPRPPEDSL